MSMKCPDGHSSTASDFCSECGLALTSAPAPATAAPAPAPATTGGREKCPKCHTDRDDASAQFCGVCAYDFVNKVGGNVVPPPPPAVTLSPSAVVDGPGPELKRQTQAATPSGARMDIEVVVNGGTPLKFSLFDEESLIGRKSTSVAQTLGIEGDGALARRQIMITRQSDGSYSVRDLDSANGTKVNGTDVKPGIEQPLKVGDVIAVGEFTRITVKAIRQS